MSIYKEFNIQPIINASGSYTMLGGSKMSKQTLMDMESASENFVQIKNFKTRYMKK